MVSSYNFLAGAAVFMVTAFMNIEHTSSHREESENQKYLEIPQSCDDLADGLYYIKPSDDGAIMPAYCDNGFTMINLALHFESVSSYFTSFYQTNWNDNGIYTVDCEISSDESSWREWWQPATKDTLFRVSANCDTCEASLSYGDNTGYYLTNYYFCWNKHHSAMCEYTPDEVKTMSDLQYEVTDDKVSMCNICDDDYRTTDDLEWLDCMSLQLDADTVTSDNHDDCMVKTSLIVKPSIANNGEHCTCYKNGNLDETSNEEARYYSIQYGDDSELDEILPSISQDMYDKYNDMGSYIDSLIRVSSDSDDSDAENSDECTETNKVYLSNKDFESGTYRITECGEYILTEDILLHFNKPNIDDLNDIDWSPNDYTYENLPWFPTIEQQITNIKEDNTGEFYNGPIDMRGTYQAGFYAGITIECSDVIINLNDKTIEMDYIYYFQQRFFTVISLGNRPFVNDQGPANFGRQYFTSIDNIIIKDGSIGLSSHHGIHGNGMSSFSLSNVNIGNFDVAGLACNGCHNGIIENTVIGPQNDNIPVLGKYAHTRSLLPRLNYLVENYGNEEVTFGGIKYGDRSYTMKELADELVEQMDLIYNYFVRGVNYDEIETDTDSDNSEQWLRAKEIFFNEYGYSDGGTAYGIILNGLGTGVTSYGRRMNDQGSNIELNNVEIYGIQNQPWEKYWSRYKNERQLQGFFFDTIDWDAVLDSDNGNVYAGNAYWNIVFATKHVANKDEFCLYNTMFLNKLTDWVFEDDVSVLDNVNLFCGSDVQSHDAKGTIGLRIDANTDVKLNNVYIHDIDNHGYLGNSEDCGDYDVIGFLSQTYKNVEPGYTGTRAQGIIVTFASISEVSNVVIENIGSKYGTAIGASIYQGTTVAGMDNININGISAGHGFGSENEDSMYDDMSETDVLSLGAPNYVPMACGLEIGEYDDDYPISLAYDNIDDSSIVTSNINGYSVCDLDSAIGTSMDNNVNNKEYILNSQNKEEIIKNIVNANKPRKYGKFDNSNNNNNYNYTTVIGVSVIFVACLLTLWKCSMYSNNKHISNIHEKSPLLDKSDDNMNKVDSYF